MSMPTPPSTDAASRDPIAMLTRMTHMQVCVGRQLGDDDAKIGTNTRQAIADALANRGPFLHDADLGQGVEPVVSMSGMFRMAINEFDLDTANPFECEMWVGVVERALTDALSRTDGDYQRRVGA